MIMDSAIVRNLDRARVYGLLAGLFQPPQPGRASELRRSRLPDLHQSLKALGASEELLEIAGVVAAALHRAEDEELVSDWEANFEASGELSFSPTEAAHTAKPGTEAGIKTQRIADIASFYKAFGLDVVPGTDRPDHLGAELEFLHVLALKEAIALDEDNAEAAGICREAARWFLEEHLGEWSGKVSETLSEGGVGQIYPAASALLDAFVTLDRAAYTS